MPPRTWIAPLGRLHIAVHGQGRGQLDGQPGLGAVPVLGPFVVPEGGGVPVAATACSTATSMSASRCLTPWNWPMGRPNWCRVRACSAAVSRHQRAPPHASAATTTRVRSRMRRVDVRASTRPAGTATSAKDQRADRREGSKLGSGSIRTAGPASTRTQWTPSSASTGASTRATVAPLSRGPSEPDTCSPPSGATHPVRPGSGTAAPSGVAVGRARVAGRLPSISPGSSSLASSAAPLSATTAATSAVLPHGPGAAARPNTSAATASSTRPAPCPPNSSPTWIPSVAWAPRSFQKGGRVSVSASRAARTASGGQRDSTQRCNDVRSSSCSSRRPMDTVSPRSYGHPPAMVAGSSSRPGRWSGWRARQSVYHLTAGTRTRSSPLRAPTSPGTPGSDARRTRPGPRCSRRCRSPAPGPRLRPTGRWPGRTPATGWSGAWPH